jgi:hypothetical protein
MKNLRKDLSLLLHQCERKTTISLGEILGILSGKGRLLLLILLSLPFCLPLQIPGLSTPFGLAIAFIGLRMAFGKRVWLPQKALLKEISSATIRKISQKGLKWIAKMERFIHPRLTWLSKSKAMYNGLLIVVLGLFLALPLPIPLTNLSSGWAILLLSIGLLEDDGLFILAGYLVSLLTGVFFILLTFSIKWIV